MPGVEGDIIIRNCATGVRWLRRGSPRQHRSRGDAVGIGEGHAAAGTGHGSYYSVSFSFCSSYVIAPPLEGVESPLMAESLERRLEEEMHGFFMGVSCAPAVANTARRYLHDMLETLGGLETAHRLLRQTQISSLDGFKSSRDEANRPHNGGDDSRPGLRRPALHARRIEDGKRALANCSANVLEVLLLMKAMRVAILSTRDRSLSRIFPGQLSTCYPSPGR